MSRLKILPHRTAGAECVSWGRWLVETDGSSPKPVDQLLRDWDYRTELAFSIAVEVDVDAVHKATGLSSDDLIGLVGVIDCQSAGRRFCTTLPCHPGLNQLEVGVPAGTVADEVVLAAHLVLLEARGHKVPGVAYRSGSRLAEGARERLILEGSGARFPTDAASFRALNLPESMWALKTVAESMSSVFNGSTKLLINSDIPESMGLLVGDVDSRLQRFLQIDVARHLLQAASSLCLDLQELEGEWEEGSIGSVVENLTTNILHSDLVSMVQMLRDDPQTVEALLQECYRPWEVEDAPVSAAQ